MEAILRLVRQPRLQLPQEHDPPGGRAGRVGHRHREGLGTDRAVTRGLPDPGPVDWRPGWGKPGKNIKGF